MRNWLENRSPAWEVRLDGKKLDSYLANNIEEILTEDSELKASSAEIILVDPEYRLINSLSSLFKREIQIFGGWHGVPLEEWFSGLITQPEVNFQEDGKALVTLTCTDRSTLLDQSEEMILTSAKDSDMVLALLSKPEYGLTPTVEDTEVIHDQITKPAGIRDIDFIMELVQRNPGFTFYTEGKKAFFVQKKVQDKSIRNLAYKKEPFTLINFKPLFNAPNSPSGVEYMGLDEETGRTVRVSADLTRLTRLGYRAYDLKTSTWRFVPPSVMATGLATVSPEQAKKQAEAIQEQFSYTLTGAGECLPDPRFRAKETCLLDGLGDELSGTWYTTMVRNIISKAGWKQRFEVKSNGPGPSPIDAPALAKGETQQETGRKRKHYAYSYVESRWNLKEE